MLQQFSLDVTRLDQRPTVFVPGEQAGRKLAPGTTLEMLRIYYQNPTAYLIQHSDGTNIGLPNYTLLAEVYDLVLPQPAKGTV